jgi:hypothetical protein
MVPSLPNAGTPYGHAAKQSPQPSHWERSTRTTPSAARLVMAPGLQTAAQAGSAQCLHVSEEKV